MALHEIIFFAALRKVFGRALALQLGLTLALKSKLHFFKDWTNLGAVGEGFCADPCLVCKESLGHIILLAIHLQSFALEQLLELVRLHGFQLALPLGRSLIFFAGTDESSDQVVLLARSIAAFTREQFPEIFHARILQFLNLLCSRLLCVLLQLELLLAFGLLRKQQLHHVAACRRLRRRCLLFLPLERRAAKAPSSVLALDDP